MIFKFEDNNGINKYEFHFTREHQKYVDIHIYTKGILSPKCWLHLIKDGKVIWRYDNWMELTKEAKDYISQLVRLRAFI
jgi:hypothetical protein